MLSNKMYVIFKWCGWLSTSDTVTPLIGSKKGEGRGERRVLVISLRDEIRPLKKIRKVEMSATIRSLRKNLTNKILNVLLFFSALRLAKNFKSGPLAKDK